MYCISEYKDSFWDYGRGYSVDVDKYECYIMKKEAEKYPKIENSTKAKRVVLKKNTKKAEPKKTFVHSSVCQFDETPHVVYHAVGFMPPIAEL